MALLKRIWSYLRENKQASIGIVVVVMALAAMFALKQQAAADAKLRKSPTALEFEKSPEDWLKSPQEVSQFQKDLNEGRLSAVAVAANSGQNVMLLYTLKSGEKFSALVPGCTAVSCTGTAVDKLAEKSAEKGFSYARVDVDWRSPSQKILDGLGDASHLAASFALMAGAIFLLWKLQMGGDGNKPAAIVERPDVRFSDVVGAHEAKAALQRVKAFMVNPQSYARLGARAPHGVLLKGPPGTGKTLLAKALAGETGSNFIAVDGSYFTSPFYGMGVMKVSRLFKMARKMAPCLVFIDEADGMGKRTQGESRGGGESEMNRIINRILVELDGFEALDNVVVISATNHEANIDEAMRRPGRFDMLVEMKMPLVSERRELFDLYVGKVRTDGLVDSMALARMTQGMSPADVANTVNKAASTAAEQGADSVTHEHFLRAIETHQLGGEVSAVKQLLTVDTRRRLAYHEAGHALIAHCLKAGVVERVTIEPRGGALGVTYVSRESEEPLFAQTELTSRLAMMLGGREAELLAFGNVSSGASDDLKKATSLSVDMVSALGFSETFGLMSVAGVPRELLGPDIQACVLSEARRLLEEGQMECRRVFREHRAELDALVECLLDCDYVAGDSLTALLEGKGLQRSPA